MKLITFQTKEVVEELFKTGFLGTLHFKDRDIDRTLSLKGKTFLPFSSYASLFCGGIGSDLTPWHIKSAWCYFMGRMDFGGRDILELEVPGDEVVCIYSESSREELTTENFTNIKNDNVIVQLPYLKKEWVVAHYKSEGDYRYDETEYETCIYLPEHNPLFRDNVWFSGDGYAEPYIEYKTSWLPVLGRTIKKQVWFMNPIAYSLLKRFYDLDVVVTKDIYEAFLEHLGISVREAYGLEPVKKEFQYPTTGIAVGNFDDKKIMLLCDKETALSYAREINKSVKDCGDYVFCDQFRIEFKDGFVLKFDSDFEFRRNARLNDEYSIPGTNKLICYSYDDSSKRFIAEVIDHNNENLAMKSLKDNSELTGNNNLKKCDAF